MASTLTVDNIVGATTAANVKLPTGSIVQTVQYIRKGEDGVSMSSLVNVQTSSHVDVMSKAIVTKFANSLIFVKMNCVFYESQSGQSARSSTKILRNGTEINADKYGAYTGYNIMTNYLVSMLDTPSAAAGTTLTYKLQARRQGGGTGQCLFGYGDSNGGSSATIVLMEIAQ